VIKKIYIKNFALIKELSLDLGRGLSVITGETGAGKSIILDAIELILGKRSDIRPVLDKDNKSIIELTFNSLSNKSCLLLIESKLADKDEIGSDYEIIIRKEIYPNGKSRAFINDTPVTMPILKSVSLDLMDLHGQNHTLLLHENNFSLKLVDSFAKNIGLLYAQYQDAYQSYLNAKLHYETLVNTYNESGKKLDYAQFLLEELVRFDFKSDEQAQLEKELVKLENAELIRSGIGGALQVLSGSEGAVTRGLSNCLNDLHGIQAFNAKYAELYERLHSCIIEVDDIVSSLEVEYENICNNVNVSQVEYYRSRLSDLYRLQKKHQVNSIDELYIVQSNLQSTIDEFSNMEADISSAEKELELAKNKAESCAQILSEARKSVIHSLKASIMPLLGDLNLANANIEFFHSVTPMGKYGIDEIKIFFSANKGIELEMLHKVASGGELSRLMLCFKSLIADNSDTKTLIFDEIDTGISGETSLKMAKMLKAMSVNHQVIAVTHLPQVASKGDVHFHVYKDFQEGLTISKVAKLSHEERVAEIAKMIGGISASNTVILSAREMLSATDLN
jgi:DNA repair protein RecN (Recombination protein N)